ncbi:MAG: hypothetical protein KDK97_19775, partial [Verrucomicrobiales bacterium]|nr:hypothetical protein [Verrucomicrobiales bacterium]
ILGRWLWSSRQRTKEMEIAVSRPPSESKAATDSGGVVVPHSVTQHALRAQGSPLMEDLLNRSGAPEDDLENVRQIISQYVTALQNRPGPPIGDNRDLVRALTGRNPLRLVVIPPGHPLVNPAGELMDRWGTPYHLHPLSEKRFEIRSAGPDHRLFTTDDVIAK